MIPVPIGPLLPQQDQEEDISQYHRLMLILFKPWSTPSNLIHGTGATDVELALKAAFDDMVQSSPQTEKYLMNMQALHECKDSCDDHFHACQQNQKTKRGTQ